jgi:hypothetical protein
MHFYSIFPHQCTDEQSSGPDHSATLHDKCLPLPDSNRNKLHQVVPQYN